MSVENRFDRLYQENFAFVWAAARQCGAPDGAVDEAVQGTFVVAFRRLDELRWEVSPRGWLYGLARQIVAGLLPRRRQALSTTMASWLEQLDAAHRETFVMAELLGLGGPEIAAELAIPHDTVYARVRSARTRLTGLAGSEPALNAQIGATQRADRSTRRDQERTWVALGPRLASSRFSTANVAVGVRVGLVPLLVLSLAGASYGLTKANNATIVSRAEAEAAQAVAEPTRSREQPRGPYQRREDSGTKVLPKRSPDPTPAAMLVAPASVGGVPAVAPAPGAGPPRAGPPRDARGLIDEAKALLAAGDTDAALAKLDEHARSFPTGETVSLRKTTRIQALCKAGRRAEAEAVARALGDEVRGFADCW